MDADRALVEAAAAGDRDAFDELVRRYQGVILGLARSLTAGSVDAEDIAQDVFVRAWRSLRGFRGESTFRTWLHQIALNVVRSHHGRLARLTRMIRPSPAQEEATDPVEWAADRHNPEQDAVLRDGIDRALAALPEELRVAVVLRDVQGLEYREIADMLGIPIGTVESRIFRGRQRLRPVLAPLMQRRSSGG